MAFETMSCCLPLYIMIQELMAGKTSVIIDASDRRGS